MARTLTAGATTQKDARATDFDVLVESESLNMRYSLSTTTAGGHTWEHRIAGGGIGDIVQSTTPGGGLGAVTTLRLLIVDDHSGNSPSSLVDAFGDIKGAALTLSILLEGEAYADKIVLFGNAEITDYVRVGALLTEIVAADRLFLDDRQLPQTLLPSGFPDAAPASIGKGLALVYGDGRDILQAPMQRVNTTTHEYRVAGHQMRAMGTWASIYLAHDDIYKQTNHATVDATNGSYVADAAVGTFPFGEPTTGSYMILNQIDVANAPNAINETPGVAVISTDSDTDVNGDGRGLLSIKCVPDEPRGSNTLVFELLQHRGGASAAATVNMQVSVWHLDAAGSRVGEPLINQQGLRFYSGPRDFTQTLTSITIPTSSSYEALIEVLNDGGLGGANDTWEVDNVAFQFYAFADGEGTPMYLSSRVASPFEGRPDDGLGTYTGSAGALIENPADVLYHLLVGELELPFDTSCIAAARSRLSGWKFAGGLGGGWAVERSTASEVVDRLAKQCKTSVVNSPAGLCILPYISTTAPVYTFDADNMLWAANTNPASQPQGRVSTVSVNRESFPEVSNSFEIHYAYNPGSQKFDKVHSCTPDGTSSTQGDAGDLVTLCNTSATNFGRTAPRIVESDLIYDDTTAELELDHMVRYFAEKRTTIRFETGAQALHLELGDFIVVDHFSLPLSVNNGQKFEIHEITSHFYNVQGTHGQSVVDFRIEIMASAPATTLSTS